MTIRVGDIYKLPRKRNVRGGLFDFSGDLVLSKGTIVICIGIESDNDIKFLSECDKVFWSMLNASDYIRVSPLELLALQADD
jgi:hypothetical protein